MLPRFVGLSRARGVHLETSMFRRATILVVEDDGPTRVALTQLLEDEGYLVIAAADGLEGKRRLCDESVDLVVSDVTMPGLDGYELLAWLRSNPEIEHTPVILWSTYAAIDSDGARLQQAPDEYLLKPIEPATLLARIRFHLERD